MITHLEPNILKFKVKRALWSITTNKASGGDGIPAELFQILKDDAVKVLHSICQQIWKTQQWPQDWKRSVFIPIPKKGNAKNAQTTAQLYSSFHEMFPWCMYNFLEEISGLSPSVVIFCFFALITEEDFPMSPCYSLKWSLLSCIWLFVTPWPVQLHLDEYLSFSPLPFTSLLFTDICKTSSDNHFAFLHFFFLGMFLIPASLQCHESLSIVLQALSIRSNPLNLFLMSTL